MNWDSLHDKLIRAARRHPPGDQVPYAFEKRVMAVLAADSGLVANPGPKDDWSAIARALWWAAGACSAIALAMSVWTYTPDRAGENFAEDLEQTILASVVASVDNPALDPEFDFQW